MSWIGPGMHLELTWRGSGPEFDNFQPVNDVVNFCTSVVKVVTKCIVLIQKMFPCLTFATKIFFKLD